MAAEMALLVPVVNITITKVIEQLDLAVGFKQELRSFRKKLDMVWGVLQDSEQRNLATRPDLTPWLKELWSIAEKADDVMDEIAYENLRRKVAAQKHMLKQVCYFFTPSSNPLVFRIKMVNKIKDLKAGLVSLNKDAYDLGLQYRLANFPEHRENQQITDSFVDDSSKVVGRDGDVQKLVQLLIDSSNQQPLSVVSIVGLPGLGKTTLAKLVRNNDKIQGHFLKIMWICVSENFDVRMILVQMLESLTQGGCENITNRDVMVQKIKEKLEEKNYLLILDDVWNEDRQKWEDLRSCLLGISDKNGSSVLVTTRIQNVASVMGTLPGHVHCLKQLKDDECWSIIRRRVFGNSPIPLELETIGRENVEKCKGVPLVASVIGGILCNDANKDVWCEVWGSIEEADGVLSVLQLSFSRLPKPGLKQCFAFCSIFPKDFVMRKEMLVQLWMAHGFLSCERQMEMEAVGDKYFSDLLSYSLFQDAEKDCYGRVITCKMHDLIHDLAQSVSKTQTLILGNGSGSNITPDIRHLNLISKKGVATGDAMQNLHTLFSKTDVFHNVPVNFKKVRVLSFCGSNIDKLPTLLRKLKHLRFLDVSRTNIKELPEFVSKLYQLQTLRFMDCVYIERPLEGIGNLVNLRHVYFNDEKQMPAGVGTLTCLQTLQLFVVGQQEGRQIEELGGLSQLRGELVITNLKVVRSKDEAKRAKLLEKTAIQELELGFGKKPNESECRSEERRKHDEDVLEGLRPHSNLKSLKITNYCGEKCPSWMLEDHGNLGESTFLKNLVSLSFYDCPQLKSMPSLSLSNGAKVEIKFCKNLKSIADSHLQELKIYLCSELVCIEFGPLFMPSLKKLEINGCDKLESLPMFSGIEKGLSTFMCLTELSIGRCHNLELVPSLGGLLSLQKIYIYNCFKLKSVGGSLSASTCLKELCIIFCASLELVPSLDGLSSLQKIYISCCGKLKYIGDSLSASTCLKELSISSCDSLELVPSLDGLSSLQKIDISKCGKMKCIGESLSASTCLKELSISYCDSLKLVPSLDGLTSLQKIDISRCGKMKCIGESLSASTCLKELSVSYCDSLELVPSLDGLSSLQKISITHCEKLKSIGGNLSASTCLKELSVRYCGSLGLVPSLDGLSSLQKIDISRCEKMICIGGNLSASTCLKELSLSYCDSLELVPSLDGLSSLQKISITHCEKLKSIMGNLSASTCLKELSVSYCDSLELVPSLDGLSSLQKISVTHCEKLKSIGGNLSASTCLKELFISYCDSLELVLSLDGLSSLQNIYINWCGQLKSIGGNLSASTCLKKLSISYCDSLDLVPSLDELSCLQIINISYCEKLKCIGESLSASACLKKLVICRCDSLEFVPSLHGLSSLQSLIIKSCNELTSFPSGLPSCTALEVLEIRKCHNLISIPEDLADLRSLVQLKIAKCGKLRNISGVREILGIPLAHLKVLQFGGFSAEQEELEEYPIQLEVLGLVAWEKLKHLPDQIQRLTALRKLRIDDFDGLEALPDWLGNLSSLQYLGIFNCKSLKHVEAIRRLSNLDTLEIWGCPELSERCARESGSDWSSISHVSNIRTDNGTIGSSRRSVQWR